MADDTVYGDIMTKLDKLKEKLLRRPTDMRFEEVKTILRNHGFENVRTKGSHFFFTNNIDVISIPVHNNTVKKAYLENIIEILNLED
jgi:predicted RNA binding protein YcfA (HicA-like mRNA interferase family)